MEEGFEEEEDGEDFEFEEGGNAVPSLAVKEAREAQKDSPAGVQGHGDDPGPVGPRSAEEIGAKAYRHRCVEKCVYKGKLVREGEIVLLSSGEKVPRFELVKAEGEDGGRDLCRKPTA